MIVFLLSAQNIEENRNEKLELLISKTAEGDRAAFSSLYEMTSSSVYGFALSVLKNSHNAEDVMQNTFIKIWENAYSYSPNGKPMAWILTVTKNLSLMKLRTQGKIIHLESQEVSFLPAEDNTSLSAENRVFLSSVLGSLDDTERQILILHSVSGLKFREIAGLLGMLTATVISKHHRAIAKIKRLTEEKI